MVLSKRLQMVADYVPEGRRLADVGCDHAHIPIYLIKHGRVPAVIAMDVRPGPLSRAEENIARYHCTGRITTRLSDGLRQLKPGEADTILIAGMGGGLTVRILTEGIECVRSAERLVLQPQSERGAVRRFLQEQGYSIEQEEMCLEDGKYYNVMLAVNYGNSQGCQKPVIYDECDYEYGKILLDGRHPVLYDYLKEEYRKALVVKANLTDHSTVNTRERLPIFLEELTTLERALERCRPTTD
jgi:tRNA (adenine22-N1)-methyltransferase